MQSLQPSLKIKLRSFWGLETFSLQISSAGLCCLISVERMWNMIFLLQFHTWWNQEALNISWDSLFSGDFRSKFQIKNGSDKCTSLHMFIWNGFWVSDVFVMCEIGIRFRANNFPVLQKCSVGKACTEASCPSSQPHAADKDQGGTQTYHTHKHHGPS